MNIETKRIKYKVGDLVLTYTLDGETPRIGMIIEIRHKLVHVEWYVEGSYKHVTTNGKTMTQFQRKAYLEYREENPDV